MNRTLLRTSYSNTKSNAKSMEHDELRTKIKSDTRKLRKVQDWFNFACFRSYDFSQMYVVLRIFSLHPKISFRYSDTSDLMFSSSARTLKTVFLSEMTGDSNLDPRARREKEQRTKVWTRQADVLFVYRLSCYDFRQKPKYRNQSNNTTLDTSLKEPSN